MYSNILSICYSAL